jgi:hypothetical protein
MSRISNSECLHERIFSLLEADIRSYLKADANYTKAELLAVVFRNYRQQNNQHWGLRLTALGHKLLSKHYSCYGFEHNGSFNHGVLLMLDKSMKWPYYLNKKSVFFYNQEDAAWFRLNGNDLSQYAQCI